MKRKIFSIVAGLCILLFAAPKAKAATQLEIDAAIQKGLAWLATQQQSDGRFGYSSNPVAHTAAAVLAFENEGHFPGGGTEYSDEVERGLDFIFRFARVRSISMQPYGDPDTNEDGLYVSFYDDSYTREVYESGMVMQAIVASNTPDRLVTTGSCTGWTYRRVMENLVDWAAFGQVDYGTGRGGWRYYANYGNSDNSTAQWPVLGLVAAEQWGIHAPQFVKDELNIWIDYIQNDSNGGSGYHDPWTYVNISKTGGLLVEMYYVGDDQYTSRAQAAINFINSRWNNGPSGTWYGNKGHAYAMFSVFKGLELMDVDTIPNALASPETPAGDWWGDYCEYLVNAQIPVGTDQGYWGGYSYWNHWLSTAWYIVILQATVFPVEVTVDAPECACDTGYEVEINYSVERFEADGTLEIYKDDDVDPAEVVLIEAFQGSASHIHVVDSDDPGTHTWRAVLNVTAGDVSAQAEDTDSLSVCETPQVGDIPDQITPFSTFDLDDYLTYEGGLEVSWSASDPGGGWTVVIDGENVVTVTSPVDATDPVTVTFTASVECCTDVTCSDSDDAVFTPNRPPVADAGDDQVVEQAYLGGADVTLDGSGSYDPDGDDITYLWTWDGGSASEVSPVISLPLGTTVITLVVTDTKEAVSEPDVVVIEVVDTTPPEVSCVESVNPHGNNIPGKNRPDKAVSKGKNPDGFYQILAEDICDAEPEIFVGTSDNPRLFGPFTSGIVIKFTEAPGASPSMKKIGSANGQAGAVTWHITLPTDPIITVVDDA
ncbi:MAG: hypothetical protein PVF66_10950, partial [Candidatus Aminicenantes bacterium]